MYFTTLSKKQNDIKITSYQGKKKKYVRVLSSLCPNVTFDNIEENTPETVLFYNQTKYGRDIVDQMLSLYTNKYRTRCCPTHVFCNVLDMCALNACILYIEVTWKKKLSRWNCILQICVALLATRTASRGGTAFNLTP